MRTGLSNDNRGRRTSLDVREEKHAAATRYHKLESEYAELEHKLNNYDHKMHDVRRGQSALARFHKRPTWARME